MSWDTISKSNSFRSSVGDKVTREDEVTKWDKLLQTAGIDNLFDQIVQFMWKTGYTGQVVDDKIFQNLNVDQPLAWDKVPVKRPTLHERIQLLHQM
jgi:hypothetical protein